MEQRPNIDKFPGYPHYPGSEDIINPESAGGKPGIIRYGIAGC